VQLVLDPTSEKVPKAHAVQPSNSETAAAFFDYWPAGHSCVVQLVFDPVPDHLPAPQSTQPSVADVAAILVDF